MHPFRAAVEARDPAAIEALLADNVVFTSPVAFTPYSGKPITAAILLILFHAISKALMFLCVGAIEQKIGSRDIEDMRSGARVASFSMEWPV